MNMEKVGREDEKNIHFAISQEFLLHRLPLLLPDGSGLAVAKISAIGVVSMRPKFVMVARGHRQFSLGLG